MFTHHFVGGIIFTLFLNYSPRIFLTGAILGAMPDILNFPFRLAKGREFKVDKWCHLHRNPINHSLLMNIVCSLGVYLVIKSCENSLVNPNHPSLAVLFVLSSHPLLDTIGLGWGVKLFYPFSNKYYKLFYKGKLVTIWTEEEQEAEAEKYGQDDWLWSIALNPRTTIGKSEWLSILGLIWFLVILPLMGK